MFNFHYVITHVYIQYLRVESDKPFKIPRNSNKYGISEILFVQYKLNEKNTLYALVMFCYLAYGVRTSLNTIFFVKVLSAIGVFLSLSFLFDTFLFFPSAFFLAFFFSIFLASSSCASASGGRARILILILDVALDIATYNWPWENMGAGRYTPTFGVVWPYDLLTIMAKLSLIGNCFLLN